MMRFKFCYSILALCFLIQGAAIAQEKIHEKNKPVAGSDSETVFTTFNVKEGKEAEFLEVYAKAWSTYRQFNMVLPQPHLLLQGQDESNKPYFIEVLTWKDHNAPDNAPPEVRAIWNQMEALCERRQGHRGIEFSEVQVVEQRK